MVLEDLTFYHGALRLEGTLVRPDAGRPFPVVVVLHAAGGGPRAFPFYSHLLAELPGRGIGVFLCDRRGSGRSAGDFTTVSFADLAGDAAAAVGALRMRADIDESRLGLYGISQGGWIAPLVASQDPGISFLVIVSGCGVSPAAQMDYAAGYALRAAGYPAEVIGTALALRQRVNDFYRGELPAETVKAEIADVEGEPWYEHTYIGESEGLPEDVTRDKWYYELDHDPLPA